MKKICILGSGYSGLFCASNLLSDKSYKNKFEITVFDQNSYHQLLQQIHLVCSGIKKPEEISFSINDLMKDEIKFFQDIAIQVNFNKQEVLTKRKCKSEYDYLIVALGASNSYFEIEGAKEFSQSFRSLCDAMKLQKKIQQLKHKNIVICGGGATGISLAGALSENPNQNTKIIIVEAQPDILPGWNRNLVKTIKEFLENKNVDLITNNPIKKVKSSSVLLIDGKIIEDCLSIWTAGIRGCNLSTIPEIKRTTSNRIIVNKFSQIGGYENAFAIGDISAFPLDNGQNSPQLAQFAVRQAKNVAKNILKIENGEKMTEFHYEQHGNILSLGKTCLGMIGGIIVSSSLCQYVEDFLIDNYIKTIKNRGRGISSLAYEQDKLSQVSASLNFMITTAAKILSTD